MLLLKLFQQKPKLIEFKTSSGETRVTTTEDYVSKLIEEKRLELDRYRSGLRIRENRYCFNDTVKNFLA